MNHVFLSYRQESPQHAHAVRRLGELLRQARIPVELDQFYLEDHPGGPDEGWPKWCEDRANQSACVLVIPSEGWFAAYNASAPAGSGYGAAVEAALFRQYLYDEKGCNVRIRLAFAEPLPPDCSIPERLRAWHQFRPLASNTDLDQLVAWIAERLGLSDVESPTVRWPEPLADFQPEIADRKGDDEWPAIVSLLTGGSQVRILLIEAGSGFGKSELLHQSAEYARQLGIPVARLDFKASYADVPALLGQLDLNLGEHLPNFSSGGGNKTHLFLKDLRAVRRPVLVILDSYEKSTTFDEWVCQHLLPEVSQAPSLAVIVAGHRCPDAADVRWRKLTQRLCLGPISDATHWEQWLARCYPSFPKHEIHVPTLVLASGGVPKTFSDMCKTIALATQESV